MQIVRISRYRLYLMLILFREGFWRFLVVCYLMAVKNAEIFSRKDAEAQSSFIDCEQCVKDFHLCI